MVCAALGGTQIWALKPQAQSSLCATLACPSGGLQAWLGPYFWSQCQCTNLGVWHKKVISCQTFAHFLPLFGGGYPNPGAGCSHAAKLPNMPQSWPNKAGHPSGRPCHECLPLVCWRRGLQALDAHGALGQHALLSCMPNGLDVLKVPPTICLCSCLGELAQCQPSGAHSPQGCMLGLWCFRSLF